MWTTATVTTASGMYFSSRFFSSSRNWSAVLPAAISSPTSGNEMPPSGRTSAVAFKVSSFHTEMSRLSSGPIT